MFQARSVPGSPLDIDLEIGRKAHLLCPSGVALIEEPWEQREAVVRTAAPQASRLSENQCT